VASLVRVKSRSLVSSSSGVVGRRVTGQLAMHRRVNSARPCIARPLSSPLLQLPMQREFYGFSGPDSYWFGRRAPLRQHDARVIAGGRRCLDTVRRARIGQTSEPTYRVVGRAGDAVEQLLRVGVLASAGPQQPDLSISSSDQPG